MEINAEAVRRLRTTRNWSQEKLSEASGLSLRTVQRLESTGKASIDSVGALATALNVEPKTLICVEDAPVESPVEAIKAGFIQFGDFAGRSSRYEYWWFFLFTLVVSALAVVISEPFFQVVSLIVLIPLIAAGTRRLHDTGRSGWWQLLAVVPFAGFIVLYLLAQPTNRRDESQARAL